MEQEEDNNLTEKETHIFNHKHEKGDPEVRVNEDRSKEGDFWDIEDYFQMEFIEGETVFVCNICNEVLDNWQEEKKIKKIKDNHEISLNDDSELYEFFDEEGHRIIWLFVKLDLVQVDCTATSLETGRGRPS